WMFRFGAAGWKVWFLPTAEVVHVGGASHGGRLYVENLRGQLRFLAKHRGARAAERARRLLLWSLRGRALPSRAGRGRASRDGAGGGGGAGGSSPRPTSAHSARERVPAAPGRERARAPAGTDGRRGARAGRRGDDARLGARGPVRGLGGHVRRARVDRARARP